MSGVLNRTVMWVTAKQLLTQPRLITALVVALVPFALTMVFQAAGPARGDMAAGRFLVGMYREFIVGTLLPLVAIVFGTSVFSAELSDGTIVYLLTKPEPRWRVVLSKYVVAALSTMGVIIAALFAPWMLLNHEVFPLDVLLAFAGGVAIGSLIYSALFVAFGIASKRALIFGLLYVVIIEFTLSRQIAGTKSFTIREFVLTATARIGEGNRWIGPGEVTIETAWTMGTIFLVVSLVVAWWKYQKFELAEKL